VGGGGGGGLTKSLGEEVVSTVKYSCNPCLIRSLGKECPIHGVKEVVWKCRFCCSLATFNCNMSAYPGQLTHYCSECHDQPGTMIDHQKAGTLPKCPAGPCGKQLTGPCPLLAMGFRHPSPDQECCLDCLLCRK